MSTTDRHKERQIGNKEKDRLRRGRLRERDVVDCYRFKRQSNGRSAACRLFVLCLPPLEDKLPATT